MSGQAAASPTQSPPAIPARGWTAWLPVVLGLLVLAVFAGARHGEFLLWDDDINIRDTASRRALTSENLAWMFTDTTHMRRYVPLTWLNWAVEDAVFGLTPRSAHLGNILFHAANALLLFAVTRRILRAWRPAGAGDEGAIALAAFGAAALWALHPLRVEPVAWASGRIYTSALCWLLASLLAYLAAAQRPLGSPGRRWLLAASLFTYAGSLLTYPLALTWAGVLVVLDVWVLRRLRDGNAAARRAVWLEKAGFAAIALAVGIVTVLAAAHAQGRWEPPVSLAQFGVGARIAQAFYIWAYYAWRPFVPFGLSPVYPQLVTFDPLGAVFIASAVAVIVATALVVWRARRAPGLAALWVAHLVLLLPFLGLTQHPHYPSDRYSYLAHLPWCVAAAGLVIRIDAVSRRTLAAGVAALLAVLGWLTAQQIPVWLTTESLYRHALATMPTHRYRSDLHRRLGTLYFDQERFDAAAAEYRRATEIEPRETLAHLGLGRVHERQQQWLPAAQAYLEVTRLRPNLPDGHIRLGRVLYQLGNYTGAIAAFRNRLALQPDEPDAHTDLAATLLQAGRAAEALPLAQRAVSLRPNDLSALLNLGSAHVAIGQLPAGVEAYRRAAQAAPAAAEPHLALGRVFRALGRNAEAAESFRAALARDGNLREAREALQRLP